MATLSYSFEGDSVGSLPAGWSILDPVAAGGVIEVRLFGGDNSLLLDSNSGGVACRSINDDAGVALDDMILSGTFNRQDSTYSTLVMVRHDGNVRASASFYSFDFGNDAFAYYKVVSGSYSPIGSGSKTCTASVTYNFKFEAIGTTIRGKFWAVGAGEPDWDFSITDTDISSGGVSLGSVQGIYFDDISIASSDITGVTVDQSPVGGVAVAGLEPVVKVDRGVDQSPLGTVGVAGYDPVVFAASATPLGTLSVSGKAPVVFAGTDVLQKSFFGVDVEILSFNPTVAGFPINVYPTLGTLSITGYDPTVLGQLNTAVAQTPLGTVSITGYNPVVTLPNIAAPVGSLTITGFSPTVTATASAVHLYFKFKDSYGTVWTREIDRKPPVVAVTTTYIASTTDEVILADATAGAFNITLPTVTGRNGFTYEIKKTDSSANAVTIVGTIDGDANFDLEVQDESVTLKASDAAWWII